MARSERQVKDWRRRCRRVAAVMWCAAAVFVTVVLAVCNARLHGQVEPTSGKADPGVVAQLRFLRSTLERGAGEEMQGLFPEGYFFTHVLYGLAWVDAVGAARGDAALCQEAVRACEWTLARLDSATGRTQFEASTNPPLGVFYVGWTSRLRAGMLLLQRDSERDAGQVERLRRDCRALADAFDASGSPFLCAYPNQSWPVDSVVAVAALRMSDRVGPAEHATAVQNWMERAKRLVDPATGLLPHQTDGASGSLMNGSRGSSQSMIQRFLPEVDPIWASDQYGLFRRQFVGRLLGAPGVREYPIGTDGPGDVDSGPLVFGLSASATVVTLGAARMHEDHDLANAIELAGEAVGLPVTLAGKRRYALGVMPVGDAFLAWSKAARPLEEKRPLEAWPPVTCPWWRAIAHGASVLIVLAIWCPWWIRRFARLRACPSNNKTLVQGTRTG